MDGPRDCHTEWSKSDKEMSYDIPYIRNLRKKWYTWTYLQNRKRLRLIKWTCSCQGKGYLGSLRRSHIHALFIALGAYCVAPGTLRSAVWQQGWEGGWGKKGHMYIYGCVPLLSTWNHHSIGNRLCVCVCSVAQSRSTFCSPMDCSLPGSSVHGIFQACWSGLPFPTRGDLPDPGSKPTSPASLALAGGLLITAPPGKPC